VPPLSGVSSLFLYASNDLLCTEFDGMKETRDFYIYKLPLTLFDKELWFEYCYRLELLGDLSRVNFIRD
jgi:hypothetical protein